MACRYIVRCVAHRYPGTDQKEIVPLIVYDATNIHSGVVRYLVAGLYLNAQLLGPVKDRAEADFLEIIRV